MAERPIIFSAPMVRAILDGRKTQTRRVLKGVPDAPAAECHPQNQQKHPAPYLDAYCSERPTPENPRGMSSRWLWWQVDDRACLPEFDVRYAPGDTLWVRETWAQPALMPVQYRADPPTRQGHWNGTRGPWSPSIHMPRWASRITLRVTAVRVERLQDISEEDAKAEGVTTNTETNVRKWGYDQQARMAFADLWEGIHGPHAWDANPWVVALTFERVDG